jgi:glutathione peroxidase
MFLRIEAFVFLTFFLAKSVYTREKRSEFCLPGDNSIHQFIDKDLKGRTVDFKSYQDSIILLVNVATFCQFTYQYFGLNNLQEKYQSFDRCGLKILAVPCNQFAHQEPGKDAEEIYNGLKYVRPGRGFEPQMALLKKRDVNGRNEDNLYTWLKVNLALNLTTKNLRLCLTDKNAPTKKYSLTIEKR